MVQARGGNEILSADPGEMGKYLARVSLTEHEPWVTFIGHPTVSLKSEPDLAQVRDRAMELR
jgi:hypothetical protein